jgi:hypothetical protein
MVILTMNLAKKPKLLAINYLLITKTNFVNL